MPQDIIIIKSDSPNKQLFLEQQIMAAKAADVVSINKKRLYIEKGLL